MEISKETLREFYEEREGKKNAFAAIKVFYNDDIYGMHQAGYKVGEIASFVTKDFAQNWNKEKTRKFIDRLTYSLRKDLREYDKDVQPKKETKSTSKDKQGKIPVNVLSQPTREQIVTPDRTHLDATVENNKNFLND